MVEQLILPKRIIDDLIAHAREGYPEEVCGLIAGKGNVGREVYRARNVADDRIMNYVVDPQTLFKQVEFEERGERLVAIYHSHPVSSPYPSATDARQAFYPEVVYIICSLQKKEEPEIRGWRLIQEEPEQVPQVPEDVPPVSGRKNLWARHVVLGPHAATYELWWREDHTIWRQVVNVREVELVIET